MDAAAVHGPRGGHDVAVVVTAPPELVVTLAAAGAPFVTDGWLTADQVAHRLVLLGHAVSAQQAASWLGRMSRADMPWVEVRDRYGYREYRVTRFGRTDVANRLPGVQLMGR